MVKLGLGTDLTFEVGDCIGSRLFQRQYLDGAFTSHHVVGRLENLAHSTLPQPVGNDIGAQAELGSAGTELIGLVPGEYLHLDQLFGKLAFQVLVLVRFRMFTDCFLCPL